MDARIGKGECGGGGGAGESRKLNTPQALCIPCRETGVGVNNFATGRGVFHRSNLDRHSKCPKHKEAVRIAQQKIKEQHQGHTTFASEGEKKVEKEVHTELAGLNAQAIASLRAMIEIRGSFSSYEKWMKAAVSEMQQNFVKNRQECRKGLDSMAAAERALTHKLLQTSSVYSLQADGLERVFQVEIGMVLWRLPPEISWLHQLGTKSAPWLEKLGERGPWLVHRLLAAREITAEMDTGCKSDAVSQGVLRACAPVGGSLNTKLHQHVCARMLSWSSDGGERAVGDKAVEHFPNMVFRMFRWICWEGIRKLQAAIFFLAHEPQR